ncbi:MAG: D-glycero-beta-D-manno-heptose 1-phosphate adenylyltransferase [Candidatus Omnitrophica bacterium]|nr:D-glycero-beta-D-manno-heptose 1-phosphate adenylyltransferase [Candidatus Omnitrophota bacterium]MDD5737522.1 D-glycero-beta-D-manno-heptose 1-phosphate adenylyltransferase [Candidatus Omnitrophota bacterium]
MTDKYDKKIVTLSALKAICVRLKSRKERIVFTNGCFDILHAGHVKYLRKSKDLGDILVLGLNSDSSVRRIKGPSRPVVSQKDRVAVVSSLGCVDYVTVFGEDTPIKVIRAVKPDILVKGADWKAGSIIGADFVKSYGGTTVTVPLVKGRSTSDIIRRIKRTSR